MLAKCVRNTELCNKALEPAPPTKFINNIHKAIAAISTSEIDKSLNTTYKHSS